MATDLDVANRALLALGLDRLTTLAANTSYRATRINVLFPTTKLYVLEEHDWTFAGARAQLTRAAGTPESGWEYFYDLPPDFLSTRQVRASDNDFDVSLPRPDKGCGDIAYELREPQLLSDSEEVWMLYTRNLSDLATWPQAVAEALAFKLAMDLAIPFTESQSKRQEMERLLDRAIVRARGKNTRNDAKPRPHQVGWITARFGGSRAY